MRKSRGVWGHAPLQKILKNRHPGLTEIASHRKERPSRVRLNLFKLEDKTRMRAASLSFNFVLKPVYPLFHTAIVFLPFCLFLQAIAFFCIHFQLKPKLFLKIVKMRENFPLRHVSVRKNQIACVSRRMRETWKVCVHAFWLVKKCVFIGLWSVKMTWAVWLAASCENLHFHEQNKTIHTCPLYIVLLFVIKSENNNFIN